MSLDFQGSWSHEFLKEFKKMNEQLAAISEKLSHTPAERVTLVYSPGAYATGEDVPESVTVDAGTEVEIEFTPYPSRDGYSFVGWATTDGASEAIYTEDGTDKITMSADVTLYPVFVAEPVTQYTLTYALGDYATGSVPEAVTVDAGETVQINFETVPSYDGVGKAFAGWATIDGADNPNYTEDGTNEITINADVTLYPVFKVVHTLTYSLGNDATGSVPGSVTVGEGTVVYVEFTPYPSCVSDPTKEFAGWDTTDESSTAEYSENGSNSIEMNDDVTLYPVFAAVQPSGSAISINNQSGSDVVIMDTDEKEELLTVPTGTTGSYSYTAGEGYRIRIAGSMTATLNGTYNGVNYSSEGLSLDSHDGYDWVEEPSSSMSWYPVSGDDFTITVASK